RRSDGRGSRWSPGGASGAADPWVELRIQEVGGQVRNNYRDRRQEDDPLDHRIVALPHRVQQAEPDALVREDLLDDRRAADDEAHADRQLREEGQYGVTADIRRADVTVGQAASAGRCDVVLLQA